MEKLRSFLHNLEIIEDIASLDKGALTHMNELTNPCGKLVGKEL
jgi:hypothetical protein